MVKALAVYVYHFGLSLRRTSQVVSVIERASHESVRKWYRRLGRHLPQSERRRRGIVAIDETVIKIEGKRVYLWAAIDVRSREVFALSVSTGRTDWEAEAFVRKALRLAAGDPIFLVDRGPWYEKAFRRMGLRFQHMTHGLRNAIERFFGLVKARTKRFNNAFPHRSSIQSVRGWTDAFVNYCNLENRIDIREEALS